MSLVLRFGEQVGVDLGCDVRNFDHISQLFLSILESVSFESIPGRLKRCVRVIFRDCIWSRSHWFGKKWQNLGQETNYCWRENRKQESLCNSSCPRKETHPGDSILSLWFPDYFILQAPYSVFEGDKLVLRCQSKGKKKLSAVKYTWNGRVIANSSRSWDLLIPLASSNNSGPYQCIGSSEENYIIRSNIKIIRIQGKPFISYRFI